jgi:phosphoribosyl 1,2-cyclic phosphodiesterase
MELLITKSPIHLLIIDSLFYHEKHTTHFSADEAIALCRQIKPKHTLLVGMSSKFPMHDEMNLELSKLQDTDGLDIQLAYDGLRIEIDL